MSGKRNPITYYLVTVSTSRAREGIEHGGAADRTGQALIDLVADTGGQMTGGAIVADEIQSLRALVESMAGSVDVIVLAGGTGAAPNDVTPEAILPILSRVLPGLGECMRQAGATDPRIGARAYLSRSFGGQLRGSLILGLPGSPDGARDSLAAVQPLLSHLVELTKDRVRSCQDDLERARNDVTHENPSTDASAREREATRS
jgi:molybdenum cofactor synthesis domain-containing protein